MAQRRSSVNGNSRLAGTPKVGYAVVAFDDGELTVKTGRSALIQTAASVGGTAVLASTPAYTLDQGSADIALVISSASAVARQRAVAAP